MTYTPCSNEKEIAESLAWGDWPQACTPELRDHVSACRVCGDLVLVTETFQRERSQAVGAATPGSPGTLWWRAQLRRRDAAVELVGKPILGAQIFALTVNLTILAGFLVYQTRHGLAWLDWLEQLPEAYTALHLEKLWPSAEKLWPDALFNSGWSLTVLIPALATLALLSGVVVYLASEKQ